MRSRDRGRRPRASSTAGMWDKSSSKLPHAARVAVRCMLHAHTAARSRTCGGWWPCGRRAERTSGLGRGLDGEMLSAAASARRAQSPPRIPSGRRTWPSPQEGEAWHRGRAAGPLCEPYSPCAAVPLPFGAPRASAPPADNAGQSRSAWPGLGLSGRRWQGFTLGGCWTGSGSCKSWTMYVSELRWTSSAGTGSGSSCRSWTVYLAEPRWTSAARLEASKVPGWKPSSWSTDCRGSSSSSLSRDAFGGASSPVMCYVRRSRERHARRAVISD